jgi:integrase
MTSQFKFTRKSIDAIKPATSRQQYRDTETRGLILIVQPSGKKTFAKRRSINNQDEKIRLGDYSPAFGPDEARKAAAAFDVQIDQGNNVAAARRALKDEPSFGEVFADVLKTRRTKNGKALGDRTQLEYRKIVACYFAKLVDLKISQIDEGLVKAELKNITSAASQNKAASIISVVLNHHTPGKGRIIRDHVAAAQILSKVESSKRYMTDEETARFMDALESNRLKDFFMLALLTGQRRSNVQAMKWSDLDLEKGRWVVDGSETKNGETHVLELTPEAVAVLKARKTQTVVDMTWVFPGTGKTGHLVEPKKSWARLLKDANIEKLKLHALRHTLASWIINGGFNIDVVGKALGHKSKEASRMYAHMTRETAGNAVASVTSDKIRGLKSA